jgi:hypothetical protein
VQSELPQQVLLFFGTHVPLQHLLVVGLHVCEDPHVQFENGTAAQYHDELQVSEKHDELVPGGNVVQSDLLQHAPFAFGMHVPPQQEQLENSVGLQWYALHDTAQQEGDNPFGHGKQSEAAQHVQPVERETHVLPQHLFATEEQLCEDPHVQFENGTG